jgi:hypothetical protein
MPRRAIIAFQEADSTTSAAQRAAVGTLTTVALLSFACTQWTYRLSHATAMFRSREEFRRLSLYRDIIMTARVTVPVPTSVSVLARVWHLSRSLEEDCDYRLAGMLHCICNTKSTHDRLWFSPSRLRTALYAAVLYRAVWKTWWVPNGRLLGMVGPTCSMTILFTWLCLMG